MATSSPRTAQQHYQDAERLLAVAESTGTDPNIQLVAATAAIAHSLLAAAPRRARRHFEPPARHSSPGDRWLCGGNE